MDTHATRSRLGRPSLTQLLITLAAALVLAFGFAANTAPQDHPAQSENEERNFKNGIPAHVPLKIKLKNEQAFKDRKNKEWARSLEVEIRNTGTKPIYFLYVIIGLKDFVLEDGNSVGFQVRYGRAELVDLEAEVRPEDTAIMPGESITLTLAERQWKGYEEIRRQKNKADAKKVEIRMQMINFGDGTGFESNAGVFLTAPPKRSARESLPAGEVVDARGCQPRPPTAPAPSAPAKLVKAAYLFEPASLLRAFFIRSILRCPPRRPVRATARTSRTASTGSCSVRITAHARTTANS